MNIQSLAQDVFDHVKSSGIEKVQVLVGSSESRELELTDSTVNLCRTNNDVDIRVKAISQGRQAVVSANRWNEASKENLIHDLKMGIEASERDESFDIHDSNIQRAFKGSQVDIDLEKALDRILNFSKLVKEKYPKVNLRSMPFKSVDSNSYLINSNGLALSQEESYADYFIMFSGKDGEKTGSFNYISNLSSDVPENFLKEVGLEALLEFAARETEAVAHPEEIKGDVVLTPYVLPSFLGFFLGQISTGSLISKSSIFEGKRGEKILSDRFSLRSSPFDKRFATETPFSAEGVLNEEGFIFEKGVLKNYLLDVYGAKKLKDSVTKLSTSNCFIPSGDQSFSEMIKEIKKGILLMRFSGGSPSPNGDFSGVAKNSFLIENGQITKPIKEVMISGNLVQMFNEITELSKETINNGKTEFPWIKTRI